MNNKFDNVEIAEAIELVQNAGYKVLNELTSAEIDAVPLDEPASDRAIANGKTKLGKICKYYTTDGYFAKLIDSVGFATAKTQLLADVKQFVGHGISDRYYRSFEKRIKMASKPELCTKAISDVYLYIIGLGVI